MFCEVLSEMTLLDYRISVFWPYSCSSLCIVIIYRLILRNLMEKNDRLSVKFDRRKSEFLNTIYRVEPSILKDVKTHGIINNNLAKFSIEYKPESIKTCLSGILNLWRSVLAQDRINSLNKKVAHWKNWFPYFDDLYKFYLPNNDDIGEVFEVLKNMQTEIISNSKIS